MNIKFLFGGTLATLLSFPVAFAASPSFGTGGYPDVTSTTPENVTEKTYPYILDVWYESWSPDEPECIGIVHALEDDVFAVEKLGYCGSIFSRIDDALGVGVGEYCYFNKKVVDLNLMPIDAITNIHVRNCNTQLGNPAYIEDMMNLKEKYKDYFANSKVRIPVDVISAYRTRITTALDKRLDELRGVMDQTALK